VSTNPETAFDARIKGNLSKGHLCLAPLSPHIKGALTSSPPELHTNFGIAYLMATTWLQD
jgi:hypothetical protein